MAKGNVFSVQTIGAITQQLIRGPILMEEFYYQFHLPGDYLDELHSEGMQFEKLLKEENNGFELKTVTSGAGTKDIATVVTVVASLVPLVVPAVKKLLDRLFPSEKSTKELQVTEVQFPIKGGTTITIRQVRVRPK